MDILSLIERKKFGQELSREEIDFFAQSAARASVPDYQLAALLMAIRLKGMTERETVDLTLAMADSGDRMDLSALGITVDKHSTGGVSDSTTFVVAPILAAMGFCVAKMSGRSLGFTGGTIDKLECFGGYRTAIDEKEFFRIVREVGVSITSATKDLAPADRALYALRDVTGTVDSLPLIAASVMSKKLAAGASVIVLDVKYGNGAFMKEKADAEDLARLMVKIGVAAGRKTGALVTSMDEPLGEYVGGNLECRGAIEVLRGKRNDLYRVSRALVLRACALAGIYAEQSTVDGLIDSGAAYGKFVEMIEAHGGSVPMTFALAPVETVLSAKKSGVISRIHAREIGEVNVMIGGGRTDKNAPIDHTVGIELCVRVGDRVSAGDRLAVLHTLTERKDAAEKLLSCFEIGENAQKAPLIALEI